MSPQGRVASSLEVIYRANDEIDERKIRFGYDARLEGTAVVDTLSRDLPPLAADLLEIAVAVYAVDRSVPRPRRALDVDRYGWGRRICARIPVRNPELWAANSEHLIRLLEWLSDDDWKFQFEPATNAPGLVAHQGYLFDTAPKGAVPALFSGGLDSASGLSIDLVENDVIAISVTTNPTMTHIQGRVLDRLRISSGHTATHLRYRANLTKGSKEDSQRSRGFLFLAAGIATAWGAGYNTLRFYENGIGAINLPYRRSQIGAEATRSAHPQTLFLMETLARAVSGRPFAIEAPYFTLTKAQLIATTPASADTALSQTVSCDTGFSARVPDHAPCGTCTSCLLRRQSVLASGRTVLDDVHSYRKDPLEDDDRGLNSMLWQASRLSRCIGSGGWNEFSTEFPEIFTAAKFVQPDDLLSLYRRYAEEWRDVVEAFGVDPLMWFKQNEYG